MIFEGYTQSSSLFMIITILEVITGILMNMFIIFVAYRDFINTKTLSSSYKLLVTLATFNIGYGALVSFGTIDYLCSLGLLNTVIASFIYIYLLLFIVGSTEWIMASLGFFYLIKISNFKLGCFSWMKKNISSIVPWMLLVDILLSLINSILSSLLIFSKIFSRNTTNSHPSFITILSQSQSTFIKTLVTDTALPFSIMFTTNLFTVVTLKKHSHRMKNVQTSASEQLRSYDKVVSRMSHSLLFYVIFYIVVVIFYFVFITQVDLALWLLLLVLNAFSPAQAVLLVLANPRLKAVLKDIFLCVHLREIVTT